MLNGRKLDIKNGFLGNNLLQSGKYVKIGNLVKNEKMAKNGKNLKIVKIVKTGKNGKKSKKNNKNRMIHKKNPSFPFSRPFSFNLLFTKFLALFLRIDNIHCSFTVLLLLHERVSPSFSPFVLW